MLAIGEAGCYTVEIAWIGNVGGKTEIGLASALIRRVHGRKLMKERGLGGIAAPLRNKFSEQSLVRL
jgi:hypothetical protein